MATGGRKSQLQVVHNISRVIAFGDAALLTGQQIGVLPAGSMLDKTMVQTTTAFNGSVSVVLNVGTTLLGTQLINATDVRTAAARVDTVVPIAQAGPLAVDTPIFASAVNGGTASTAGSATVTVLYIPNVS